MAWTRAITSCLFLHLCMGQLNNSNVSVSPSPSVVPGWRINGAKIYPGFADNYSCANITDTGGCSSLSQIVPTPLGDVYRLSCWAYSNQLALGDDMFANGLVARPAPWSCPGALSDYLNSSFFSPNETIPPKWMLVDLDFEPTSSATVVMLFSDITEWACYRDCTFGPTRVPTSVPTPPTLIPTSSPSGAPSRAPSSGAPTSIPCIECDVPACQGLLIQKSATDCSTITDLSQVISWAQNLALATDIRSVICAIFAREKEAHVCSEPLDRNLFVDVCAFLRNSIFPGSIFQFNAKWCMNPTTNFSNASSLQGTQEWNSSLEINYTAITHQAPCLETQKYQLHVDSSDAKYVELGPLADVVAHPEKYPNFPAIKKVSTSQTTDVLFNTACLQPTAVAPAWIGLLVVFLLVAVGSGALLFYRRNLQPIRARNPLLLWGALLLIMLNFIWISIDQLTGNTTSCGLISFGNLVAFPMLLFIYLLRGLRLLFLYKWAEGKVNHQEWFHSHRILVKPKTFLLCLGICLLICLIIFMSTNFVDGTFSETFISSGRCDWWDLNQQVIEAASQAGVALLPTDFNRNGFVPYSVEYSSCIFCSTFSTQVLMCVVTVLLLCTLIVTLFLLRKINDQFKLWFELVVVLMMLSVVAIVRSIMFFPSVAASMMQGVGSDLSALFLAVALFPILLISFSYPAMLTFTRRFRVPERPTSTTMDGEMRVNGQFVSISLNEVLNDPFGLDLYKQFALESFAVENVMCWIHYQAFSKLLHDDPVRAELAVNFYESFIRAGSVMEVNVDAPLRSRYDQMFGISGGQPSSGGSPSIEATIRHEGAAATAPADIPIDMFADVAKIIFTLMLTNCWARFKQSPFWDVLTEEMEKRAAESNPILSETGTQMSSLSIQR